MLDFARLESIEIAVFGDLIADCWLVGEVDRLCREAPVATIDVDHHTINAGGAANAAANMAGLGAKVTLLGQVGDDAVGDELCRALDELGVNTKEVVRRGVTHTKNRLVVDGKILARFDQRRRQEDTPPHFDPEMPLLIADYDMNSWRQSVIEQLKVNRPRYLAIDSHHPERWSEVAPDLLAPNWYEAQSLMPQWDGQCHRSQHVRRHREEIRQKANADKVLVTLDRDGAVLLTENNGWYVETTPAPERNTIGAGDTATAALLLALLSDVPDEKALRFASAAAQVATSQPGTTVVKAEDFVIDLRSIDGHPHSDDQQTTTADGDSGIASRTELPL